MARATSLRRRAKPGSRGGGRFFHIQVRPAAQFVAFRVQDVGAPGSVDLGSVPVHIDGDRFRARPRRDISEEDKPTPAMRRAQLTNIKKAQAAVRARRKAAR